LTKASTPVTGASYNRRNFRLVWSSKIGKNTPLTDTSTPTLTFEGFKRTLVCEASCKPEVEVIQQHFVSPNVPNSSKDATHYLQYDKKVESTWPEIDQFLLKVASGKVGGSTGKVGDNPLFIRSCVYFDACKLVLTLAKTIVYTIGNYRYCERIQREHKSNGVYFVFDLPKGTFHQKYLHLNEVL
jgi:hypothetical protein